MALKIILQNKIKISQDTIIDTANDGLEAVQAVKDNVSENQTWCSYGLILMDCNMPRMDGYQATTEIRTFLTNEGIDQPIITAVTGHTEPSYV